MLHSLAFDLTKARCLLVASGSWMRDTAADTSGALSRRDHRAHRPRWDAEAGAALHPKPLPSNYLHDTAALLESLRLGRYHRYLIPSGLSGLVIWKLLGCLSSGEAKSGLTCPILRLLSSPGLLDVEIVCKALSLLWTMDMFDMFFPGTEHGSQTVSMSNRRLIIRILVSSCFKIPSISYSPAVKSLPTQIKDPS